MSAPPHPHFPNGRRTDPIARGCLAMGLLGLAGVGAFAAAHFVFGAPLTVLYTDREMSAPEALGLLALLGSSAGFFTLLGVSMMLPSRS